VKCVSIDWLLDCQSPYERVSGDEAINLDCISIGRGFSQSRRNLDEKILIQAF